MENTDSITLKTSFHSYGSLLSVLCYLLTYLAVLGLSWAEQSAVFSWYWKLAILIFASVLFLMAIIRAHSNGKSNKAHLDKDKEIQFLREKNKKQEKDLQDAKETNHSRSRFLSQMSHEIRNPLNSILGFSELLGGRELDPKSEQFVKMISESGDGLMQILNDLLDLDKIDVGKLRLEAIRFNFKEVVSSTILPYSYIAQQKNLSFELILDPNIPTTLIADPYRFRQILINLIGNAIKFTHHGKIQVEFLNIGEHDEQVSIRTIISDTGIGIPLEKQEGIFKPFTQCKNSTTREFGGSGLGLAIVAELLKLMKGEIFVESPNPMLDNANNDAGTYLYFDMDLPIDKESFTAQNKIIEETQFEYKLPESVHILIAEDNPVNQVLFQAMLENMGAIVDIVDNGQEALHALKGGSTYDLIFMDIQMSVMDGLVASRLIRKELEVSIPIIGATANVFEEDIRIAMQAGMNDYLPKPFSQKDLYDKICRWGIKKPKGQKLASADHILKHP